MKIKLSFLIGFLISTTAFAQFGTQQIISTATSNPFSIVSADIDGDGDMDVLSASHGDNTIAWFENTDGQGDFGILQAISTSLSGTRYLNTADLDGDGDIDVLATSRGDNLVVWYRNTDGLGTFGGPFIIDNNALNPKEVIAADLDNDGDMDVVSATSDDGKVVWYKNDGFGNFGSQLIVTNSISLPKSVFAVDFDGDNDKDILASSVGNDKILWFENMDGLGNFGIEQVISNNSNGVDTIFAADLDGDGDADVLSALTTDVIDWYENLDGLGTFGSQQIITTQIDLGVKVYAVDLDNDMDMDVLSASAIDDKIAWYKNDGLGNFGSQQIITIQSDSPRSIFAADINGDGLQDVLSSSVADNKIAWYKNEILGVGDYVLDKISLYPNPINNLLTIKNNGDLEIISISLYDSLGRLILEETQTVSQIDMSSLPAGIFFVIIETEKSSVTKKVIKY